MGGDTFAKSPAVAPENQVNIVSGVQTPLTTKRDARPPLVTPFISARSKLRGFLESRQFALHSSCDVFPPRWPVWCAEIYRY